MSEKRTPEETNSQKTAEEVAALYRKKFESTKSMRTLHVDVITAELIQNIRDYFVFADTLLEKYKGENIRELFKNFGEIERQRFENGDFSINEFHSKAKDLGAQVRDGFIKTLGTKFFNKNTSPEKGNTESDSQKTAEDIALIYQKRFQGSSKINPKKITAELISEIGSKIAFLPFQVNPVPAYYQKLSEESEKELEAFEAGTMDANEFIGIAKIIDPTIQDGFFKTLRMDAWNKIREIVKF